MKIYRHKGIVTTLMKVARWLLIISLFVTSYTYSKSAWDDYYAKSSNFHVVKEPIDVEDLPTVTFCYEPVNPFQSVSDNFHVHYYHGLFFSDTESRLGVKYVKRELLMNNETVVSENGRVLLQRLFVSDRLQHCYKISYIFPTRLMIKNPFGNIGRLVVKFLNPSQAPNDTIVYFTSEPNAYGKVCDEWYDGKVEEMHISRGRGHKINLNVKLYKHLPTKCSQLSYYECRAKNIMEGDFTRYNWTFYNMTSKKKEPCHFESLCLQWSTPNIALCSKYSDEASCFTDAYHKIWADMKQGKSVCKKSCIVREYSPEMSRTWTHDEEVNGFALEYGFVDPVSATDFRLGTSSKEVIVEYLIVNEIAMVGAIGGFLGLFTGFSFLAAGFWLLDKTITVGKWVFDKCNP